VSFYNVAKCPQPESFLHNIGRGFLTQKKYFGFGGELSYPSGGFESIQLRETDVQQD